MESNWSAEALNSHLCSNLSHILTIFLWGRAIELNNKSTLLVSKILQADSKNIRSFSFLTKPCNNLGYHQFYFDISSFVERSGIFCGATPKAIVDKFKLKRIDLLYEILLWFVGQIKKKLEMLVSFN